MRGSESRSALGLLAELEGKKLVFCRDERAGLQAVIAVHSTAMGPAAGGLRMKPYASGEEAARDALRLARAMTLKYAAAGMPMGGAKAVIVGDPRREKTPELLRAFGRFVAEQGGEYSVGEDVGTNGADMEEIARETEWMVSLPEHAGGPGDVSVTTAMGVRHAMRACCQHVWDEPSPAGRSVAIQGLGQVGFKLARLLAADGARVLVADVDAARVEQAVAELGAEAVAPEAICEQEVDVLAPCALGDAIDDRNVERVRARVVCGAANNMIATNAIAERLEQRGIVYAVDFVANAGGIVYDDQMRERPRRDGFDVERAMAYVDGIYDRTLRVFEIADAEQVPLWRAALMLAEANMSAGRLSTIDN